MGGLQVQSSPLFFLHIRESRAYRRTYTDVGYEGFFNREIIGESVKPPRSLAVIPFFLLFFTWQTEPSPRP